MAVEQLVAVRSMVELVEPVEAVVFWEEEVGIEPVVVMAIELEVVAAVAVILEYDG